MQGIEGQLHLRKAHCDGPAYPVLACKPSAPGLLIGQERFQTGQQRGAAVRVLGGVKGGVQPVPEEGPVRQRQRPFRHVRLPVLLGPELCHPALQVRFQGGNDLPGPWDVRVVPVVVQNLRDQARADLLPPPLGVNQKLLLQKAGDRQGPLQLRGLEEGRGLMRLHLRRVFDTRQIAVQAAVQLQKVLLGLALNSGDPLQNQRP